MLQCKLGKDSWENVNFSAHQPIAIGHLSDSGDLKINLQYQKVQKIIKLFKLGCESMTNKEPVIF